MKKIAMFLLVVLCIPAIAAADEAVADRVHCSAGQVLMCTKPTSDGQFVPMTHNGTPLYVCSVSTDRGIDLRCVPQATACALARAECENLGDNWQWNERGCRCEWERAHNPPPPQPQPPTPPPAPPVQPGPAPTCPNCNVMADLTCSAEQLTQIEDGLKAIQNRLGQLNVLTVEEIRELRAEAENLREQANECRDSARAERATILIAALEPEPTPSPIMPPPPPNQIPYIVERQENWCLDTAGGVMTCIVLPIVAAGAAIFLGAYYGTEWRVTQ